MNEKFYNTKRWNQDVINRDKLLMTYKLDEKVLYTPAQSLQTLRHSVTEGIIHNKNRFRNPKPQLELFKVESTHLQ